MASRLTNALFRTDPTQGFIDYVQTVKPYHSKILEALVEYIWTEPINVTVCDRLNWDMVFSRPRVPTVYDCGFGVMWDPPLPFVHTTFYVNGVVTGLGGSWTIAGNHATKFTVGSLFVVGRNVGGGSGWYTVASAINSGATTVITVIETIPPLSTPHGIVYLTDGTVELILDSIPPVVVSPPAPTPPPSNYFLIVGDQTEKFLEGANVRVDNSYQGKNNGLYIVQASQLDGVNTRVYVKQQVNGAKPLLQPYNGRMFLAQEGFDQPPYCGLAQASDLHTDVFIHEFVHFDITWAIEDSINSTVTENEPRGYGVSPFGSPFGPQEGHPGTAPTTGITILPTGLDGQYFDMGGFDENLQTVVHLYGRQDV